MIEAAPALTDTSSGYRGTASDPWKDLEADKQLSGFDANDPGNVVQGARTRLTGLRGKRRMRLAIGFGANETAAAANAGASLSGVFGRTAADFHAGWAAYLSTLDDPPQSVRSNPRLRRL